MSEEQKTQIEFAGIKLTGGKLLLLLPVLSALGGSAWGAFEFYKSYQDMQKKIASYVAPDLSGYDKRMAVLESKIDDSLEIARDIRTDLRGEIGKQSDQLTRIDSRNRDMEREVRGIINSSERDIKTMISNADKRWDDKIYRVDGKIDDLEKKLDNKIQKALENPLSNLTTTTK